MTVILALPVRRKPLADKNTHPPAGYKHYFVMTHLERGRILDINNIHASYGESKILNGVTLSATKGHVTTIMGRNGVGKTTLLRSLMGIVKSTEGTINLNGSQIDKLPTHKRAKYGIGYVPQGREIIPKLTVYENILIGTESRSDYIRHFEEDEIYSMFPILKEFRNRLGGNLSGGQQQQLAIARALVGNPLLLVLDEPTEGIQPSITFEIAEVLNKLVDKGLSVLLVEQKLDFARLLSDHYYIMDRGRVIKDADKDNIDFEELKKYLSV